MEHMLHNIVHYEVMNSYVPFMYVTQIGITHVIQAIGQLDSLRSRRDLFSLHDRERNLPFSLELDDLFLTGNVTGELAAQGPESWRILAECPRSLSSRGRARSRS